MVSAMDDLVLPPEAESRDRITADERTLIDNFIAEKGVTVCPPCTFSEDLVTQTMAAIIGAHIHGARRRRRRRR